MDNISGKCNNMLMVFPVILIGVIYYKTVIIASY